MKKLIKINNLPVLCSNSKQIFSFKIDEENEKKRGGVMETVMKFDKAGSCCPAKTPRSIKMQISKYVLCVF